MKINKFKISTYVLKLYYFCTIWKRMKPEYQKMIFVFCLERICFLIV